MNDILTHDEKLATLKEMGLPLEAEKWSEKDALAAHYAFEIKRLLKLAHQVEDVRRMAA